MQAPSSPTAASRAMGILAIALGALSLFASLAAGILVALGTSFFAVNTRWEGDARTVMGSGCVLAVPLLIASALGVVAIVGGVRGSRGRPILALVSGALGLVLVAATFVVPWVLLTAFAPREQVDGPSAIQYLSTSEIGRECHAGSTPNGDCTVGYSCLGGAHANPATGATTCQIPCGTPDYCPYRTSCGPQGVCVLDAPR